MILTAPRWQTWMPGARTAHATNERSAHAPKSSKSLGHGAGCSCCSGKKKGRLTALAKDGSKSFPLRVRGSHLTLGRARYEHVPLGGRRPRLVVVLFGRGKISGAMGDLAQGIKSFKRGMREDSDAQA